MSAITSQVLTGCVATAAARPRVAGARRAAVSASPAISTTSAFFSTKGKAAARSLTVRVAAEAAPAVLGVFKLEYDISKDDKTKSAGWKPTIVIAVSGAAGQISNHLLFKIASGEVYGKDQPIALKLLGSDRSREALEGVAMELEDSLFPLLREVSIGVDANVVFADADWALLIGAKPRGPGMERSDLLEMNGKIFVEQGQALNKVAKPTCKVMVVGNPCNTNALICMENAPNLSRKNFHALTRLDENRAKCQLAIKAGVFYDTVTNVTIWGNHSTTQVPDFVNAKIGGERAMDVITDHTWLETGFTPAIQTRGGALIKKWGRSSAASTAVSIADAIKSLVVPTPEGDWFSTGVCTDGNSYGVAEGIIYSFPCRSKGDGSYEIVDGLEINDWLRERIKKSEAELTNEADCVSHLTGKLGGACVLVGDAADTMLPGEM
eukprot:CAMPEP_0197610056 /NCGR_PEP_ID=MMETSP1326-20131121/52496_1 /TAXON_ID=1155430 /ORGANISM="Genus nov. species nov., Strain RCC2288" /LENGTH=436 /DNA_ID=CAMNT_0043178515 /DNA_START=15 /DNA_END=1325 /DNA_ORIENTATION=+